MNYNEMVDKLVKMTDKNYRHLCPCGHEFSLTDFTPTCPECGQLVNIED